MAYDADVQIKIDADTSSAESAINGLQKSVEKAYKSPQAAMRSMGLQADKLTDKLRQSASTLEEFGQYKNAFNVVTPENLRKLEALERKMVSLTERKNRLDSQAGTDKTNPYYTTIAKNLEAVTQEYNKMSRAAQNARSVLAEGAGKYHNFDRAFVDTKYANSLRQTELLTRQAGIANQRLQEAEQKTHNLRKALQSLMSAVVKPFKAMGRALKDHVTRNNAEASKSFKHLLRQVLKYGLGIRSLFLLYKKLRQYGKEAFKDMAIQYPEINAQLSDLVATFSQMTHSIATAFQPLLSVVLPVLNAIMNAAIAAANAIGTFFAVLTGQGFIYKAIKQQKDFAGAVGGTGGAAKEAKEELAEYDKLLVIDQNNGGSGGGGGGAGAGDTVFFEKSELIDSAADFARMIQDAWKNADFTEVGELLGDKLNDALKSIPWSKIQETAGKIGKSLATLLNGFISPELASRQFLENFDWENLGKSLAAGVNSFFKTWNLDQLGKNIHKAIVDACKGAVTFFKETDFHFIGEKVAGFLNNIIQPDSIGGIGEALGQAITGALDFVKSFVDKIDWKTIGTSLVTGVNNLIRNINWGEVSGSISKAISGVLTTVASFIKGLDVQAIWQAIKDFISGIDWISLGKSAVELLFSALGTAIKGVLTLGADVIETVAGWFEEIGEAGWDGFWEGLWGVVTDIATWIADKFNEYIVQPIKDFFGIASPSKLMEDIGNWVMEGFLNGFKAGFELIKEWVVGAVDWLDKNLGEPIVELGAKMIGLEEDPLAVANEEAEKTAQENQRKYNYYDMRARAREAGVNGGFWDIQNYGINEAITAMQNLSDTSAKTADSISKDSKQVATDVQNDSNTTLTKLGKTVKGTGKRIDEATASTKDYGVVTVSATDNIKKSFATIPDAMEAVIKSATTGIEASLKTMPTTVKGYSDNAWTNIKNSFRDSSNWSRSTSQTISNGFNMLPTNLQTTFKSAYDKGTAQFNSTGVWAKGKSDEVVKGFATMPTDVQAKFKDAYDKGTGQFSGTSTWVADVVYKIKKKMAEVPTDFNNIFYLAAHNATAQIDGFHKWLNTQKFGATATFTVNTPEKAVIQGIYTGLASVWQDKEATFSISASADIEDMKEKVNREIIAQLNAKLAALTAANVIKSITPMPYLAKGAVIPPNNKFIAMLGDQTSGTNIETPLDTMVQAFEMALDSRGGADDRAPIILQVDGRTMAQVVWDENEKRYKQSGRRFG